MTRDFGPFELQDRIALGGMAAVYRAVQKSLARPVVLKILYPHLAEDKKFVARFEREAKKVALLNHENIVQVIDFGWVGEEPYIAMEYLEGMTLQQVLKTHGAPPIGIALLMFRDICEGLNHAHEHGIVHRDVKPANVMFTVQGTIKIMDFGLARDAKELSDMTQPGTVLGTAFYMAPEQVSSNIPVDERADIFSTGVVAYELLGGVRPFQGDSFASVVTAVLTTDPPQLDSLNPVLEESVLTIINRMLQKDVAKRYQTIRDARDDLEKVIESSSLRGKELREYARSPSLYGESVQRRESTAHFNQAMYWERLGQDRVKDAVLEYRRAAYLDPGNMEATECLQRLSARLEEQKTTQKLRRKGIDASSQPDLQPEPPTPAQGVQPEPVVEASVHASLERDPPLRPTLVGADSDPRTQSVVEVGSEYSEPRELSVLGPEPTGPQRNLEPVPQTPPQRGRLVRVGAWSRSHIRALTAASLPFVFIVFFAIGRSFFSRGDRHTSSESSSSSVAVAPAETSKVAPTNRLTPHITPIRLASIKVFLNVNATVRLDKKHVGHGQLVTFDSLAAGSYNVRAWAPDYLAERRQLELKEGQDTTLTFSLTLAQVASDETLRVYVKETHASVSVDGALQMGIIESINGKATLKVELLRRSGMHRVRFAYSPYFKPRTIAVRMPKGKTKRVDWSFWDQQPRPTGTLEVTIAPVNDAEVRVEGQNQALHLTAPCKVPKLLVGEYRIEVLKTGYQVDPAQQVAHICEDSTATVRFTLRR